MMSLTTSRSVEVLLGILLLIWAVATVLLSQGGGECEFYREDLARSIVGSIVSRDRPKGLRLKVWTRDGVVELVGMAHDFWVNVQVDDSIYKPSGSAFATVVRNGTRRSMQMLPDPPKDCDTNQAQ